MVNGALRSWVRALTKLSTPLSARGWKLVVAAIAMTLAALIFGILELYATAVASVAVLVCAVISTRTGRWRIDATRRLGAVRVGVGDDIIINLTLANASHHHSPALHIRDHVELGAGFVELSTGPIGSGQSVAGSYRLRATARGVFRLGPLSVETSDPFGLARRVRVVAAVSTVSVHPRVERLQVTLPSAGPDRRAAGAVAGPGHVNDEFSSLREYRPGDDLRRLHWRSTARSDTLMVREDQIERQGQLTLLLDLRRSTWKAATLERALSAAASIGLSGIEAGLSVRLVTTSGHDTGAGSGPGHGSVILDELAAASVHDGRAFSTTGHHGAGRGVAGTGARSGERRDRRSGRRIERNGAIRATGTLIVVGGEGNSSSLMESNGIGRNAVVVQVAIQGAGTPGSVGRGHSGRVVSVGSAGIAASWHQATR